MAKDYPIQFVVIEPQSTDGGPSRTIYLSECTCQQLIKTAENQLTNSQIQNNTFVIKDDDDIKYHSDDGDLEDAFDARQDEENPLLLRIYLDPKNSKGLHYTNQIMNL